MNEKPDMNQYRRSAVALRIYKAEVERRWAIALLSIVFGLTIGISFMYGMCGG